MKSKIKIVALFVMLLAFVLTNVTYLNVYIPHSYPYRFCADKCRFDDIELGKGHDPLRRVEINFADYQQYYNKYDINLHRRFPRKWWQIWNWIDFLTHRR